MLTMKLRLLFVVFALGSWLLCAGCHITPGPAPVPPDSGDGGLPSWSSLDPCGSALARMAALSCDPVAPATGTWVDACVNARKHGLGFGTACVREKTSKSDIAGCGVTCK
jgi:hypothetical protein